MSKPNIKKAKLLRDQGMDQAKKTANKINPEWTVKALQALDNYPHRTFMTEDLSEWAYKNGLPKPPRGQAWGHIIATSLKLGSIMFLAQTPTKHPRSHRRPGNTWIKLSKKERREILEGKLTPKKAKQDFIMQAVESEIKKDPNFAKRVKATIAESQKR